MIVWATGFKPTYATSLGLDLATIRGIHAPGEGVRMGFIGFVRPSIGKKHTYANSIAFIISR